MSLLQLGIIAERVEASNKATGSLTRIVQDPSDFGRLLVGANCMTWTLNVPGAAAVQRRPRGSKPPMV
jgi:hypothetical protein